MEGEAITANPRRKFAEKARSADQAEPVDFAGSATGFRARDGSAVFNSHKLERRCMPITD